MCTWVIVEIFFSGIGGRSYRYSRRTLFTNFG